MKRGIAIAIAALLCASSAGAADITACAYRGKAKMSDGPPKKCKGEVVQMAHLREQLLLVEIVRILASLHGVSTLTGDDGSLEAILERLETTPMEDR